MHASDWMRRRAPVLALAVVAVAFAAVQARLLPLDTFLSWDEAVYAGQFAHGVPHIEPSAHRAPGMAWLLAPVTVFTSSFTVVRLYLTVVIAVGLFLAYGCWLPVDARVAPLAAFLLAATGQVLVLARLALPNLPTALCVVAAVAFFVRTAEPRHRRRVLAGLTCTLGAAAVLRPTDAIFLAAALGVAMVAVRRWRRLDAAVAVFAGLTIGGLAWLVEAFVRFGGPLGRLEALRSIANAEGRPVAATWADALTERVGSAPTQAAVTGAVVVVAAVLVLLALRWLFGWPSPVWLVTLFSAAAVVVPYYVLLSFIAQRYLVPAKALLALVVAAALVRLATVWRPRAGRVLASCVVLVAVIPYALTQLATASETAEGISTVREVRESYAGRMAERGIRPPCVVTGYQAPAFAYALGCRTGDNLSALPSQNNWHREFQRDWRTAQRADARFVAVLIGEEPPPEVADWDRIALSKGSEIYAYFPPSEP